MRRPRWRAELGWAAALALLFLLSFWWFPGRGASVGDTFTAAAGGKKAFFALVGELHSDVHRHLEGPLPPDQARALCIIGPAGYPDAWDWKELYEWVEEGHTLLFAARYGDPAVDLGPFQLRVEPEFAKNADEEENGEERLARAPFAPQRVETELARGDLEWISAGRVVDESDAADVLVSVAGEPHVVRREVGSGRLVVASSDHIFSNLSLAEGDNGLLAYRIFEAAILDPGAVEGAIYFDESLNAAGTPQVVGLLFSAEFRPITLQLLFLVLLFGWWGSRRFGAPLPPAEPPRRSIVEHAEALGNLYFKAGSGSRAVASYLEYFRKELRAYHAAASASGLAAELARRAGVEEEKVAKLLREARRAAEGGRVSSSRAAALLRALSALKRKISRTHKKLERKE